MRRTRLGWAVWAGTHLDTTGGGGGIKSEIRNPKPETNPKHQAGNDPNHYPAGGSWPWSIGHLKLFRVSVFGFRIWDHSARRQYPDALPMPPPPNSNLTSLTGRGIVYMNKTIRDVIIDCAYRLKPGLRTVWSPGFSRLEQQSFMTPRISERLSVRSGV